MTTAKCLKAEVSPSVLQYLIHEAKDYAFSTGFVMGSTATDSVAFAPMCLFPSPFPEEWFLKGKKVQTALNLLLLRISSDIQFLKQCLCKAALTDVFIEKLFKVLNTVLAEGYQQTLTLGIFRMDYMLDTENDMVIGMKQIEMNTISTSFGALATQLHPIQCHLLKKVGAPEIRYLASNSLHEISRGLAAAWKAYGVPSAIVIFVIETNVLNFADQRLLEYSLCSLEPGVQVSRFTFDELNTLAELNNHRLFVEGQEVAVVYFRTGYMPDQYENENAWSVRLMLERSRAIQCPNVPLQLAGMKKIQQELTRDGVLEKFLPDVSEDILLTIKSLFAGQYCLDLTSEGDKAVEMALSSPERFVLKPQREGGGNNIFGQDIVKALKGMKDKDREAFVLMEMIRPPVHKNYIVRKNQADIPELNILGELGIYGVILGGQENVVINSEAGHIIRCKEHGVNEGGVAMGYGAINLPYLV